LELFVDIKSFRSHYGPAVDPACNRNEYQEYFLGVKVAGRGRCIGSWWGNQRERNHWGDLGVDGWIILGWIPRKWDVGIWTGLGWPRIERVGGRL